MHTTHLRKVGGSVMMALPPALLEMLQLKVGATVGLAVADGLLLVDPKSKQHYTLQELLDKSDFSETQAPHERAWGEAPPVGGELI
jgi:antitoxin ChpS